MTAVTQVYVVDDEEAIRDAFTFLLRSRGYAIRTFASAREFLDAYRDDWQGWLFSDVQMPVMTGVELVRELRGRNTLLSIVLMTAHENVASLRESLSEPLVVLELVLVQAQELVLVRLFLEKILVFLLREFLELELLFYFLNFLFLKQLVRLLSLCTLEMKVILYRLFHDHLV